MPKQYQFGTGGLYLTRTDIANPTARRIGVLQEVSIETKFETKALRGEYRFPVDQASGPASVTGKFKTGQIFGRLWADLLGGAATTVLRRGNVDEAASIPTTPFTITVSGAATFFEDLGVILVSTGQQMERVASAPATGQYSVNTGTGVYTFAAADTGKAVLISYSNTPASPVLPNTLVSMTNTIMGSPPTFSLNLASTYKGQTLWCKLHAVIISGLSMPLKMDDYLLSEGSFEAFDDGTGNVLSWSTPN